MGADCHIGDFKSSTCDSVLLKINFVRFSMKPSQPKISRQFAALKKLSVQLSAQSSVINVFSFVGNTGDDNLIKSL